MVAIAISVKRIIIIIIISTVKTETMNFNNKVFITSVTSSKGQ